jgi:hypothetical protein
MRPRNDKIAKPLLLNHHKWSWYIPWMIWHGFEGNQWTLCHEADWFFTSSSGKFGLIHALFWPEFMRSTDKTFKPLLHNQHKWSWYIPWMIWHGFEGNQWTLCHEADWFFA